MTEMQNTIQNKPGHYQSLDGCAATWRSLDGDGTFALNWPIDENAVVVEIGGYEGRWALQMAEKFNPNLHVFEPQGWACQKIVNKLSGYKANIHCAALWIEDGTATIGDFGRDGASLLKPEHIDKETVKTIDAFKAFEDIGDKIDVCLMNIEGGEFVLLPYMIGLGILDRIEYFWIQIHKFAPYSYAKMDAMFKMLEKTHEIWWDFRIVAICWRKRK